MFYQRIVLSGYVDVEAPGYESFPGKVSMSYRFVEKTFTFTSSVDFDEYHHTGYYAIPGQPISVEVVGALPKSS